MKKAARCVSSGYAALGSATRNARTCSGLKPGSTLVSREKLRRSSAAPTRSTIDIATSATSSAFRIHRPLEDVDDRPPSLSTEPIVLRDACQAGARPKRIPVASDTTSAKSSTELSILMSVTLGMLPALSVWIGPMARYASRSPTAPPASGEDEALGEHLEDQPPPPGAERGSDRDLFPAHRRAHEQQVGDVGAGDQDHDPDRGQKRQQCRPDPLDDAVLQPDDFGRLVRARVGILHGQALGNGLDLSARLLGTSHPASIGRSPRESVHRVRDSRAAPAAARTPHHP